MPFANMVDSTAKRLLDIALCDNRVASKQPRPVRFKMVNFLCHPSITNTAHKAVWIAVKII